MKVMVACGDEHAALGGFTHAVLGVGGDEPSGLEEVVVQECGPFAVGVSCVGAGDVVRHDDARGVHLEGFYLLDHAVDVVVAIDEHQVERGHGIKYVTPFVLMQGATVTDDPAGFEGEAEVGEVCVGHLGMDEGGG